MVQDQATTIEQTKLNLEKHIEKDPGLKGRLFAKAHDFFKPQTEDIGGIPLYDEMGHVSMPIAVYRPLS
jgi:hypothetical protein